jgi:hypothetical protein
VTVRTISELAWADLEALLEPFGLHLRLTAGDGPIPGSFWGAPEAGLVGDQLWVSGDTPVHSLLHETCHFICMSPERRARLHTDAGGDHAEEDAVCYLQILLADRLSAYGREAVLADMDAWGYSFRLGSARRWFEQDADEALAWLTHEGLATREHGPTGELRGSGDRCAA